MAITYDSITTTTLTSAVSSVTFSSISGSYTDLIIVHRGTNSSAAGIQVEFNSDTTAGNYSFTYFYGDGSTAASGRYTSAKSVGSAYTTETNNIFHFINYSNSTTYKTTLSRSNNAANITQGLISLWRSTAAITSIKLFVGAGNFDSGSTFTLYGVKAA
jgi:hypothetical protein